MERLAWVLVVHCAAAMFFPALAFPTEGKSENLCNGSCDVSRVGCNCTAACVNEGSCCVDYLQSCRVEHNLQHLVNTSWKYDNCSSSAECPNSFPTSPLIVFSIDGFHADYIYREKTPTIWKLANCGVHAPYMRSVYPTKTFPNHYTIVTGLYPESHGIVDNTMYDTELQEVFKRGSTAYQPHWWGGEPIWVTARRQGKKSAAYFWPGSDVNITMYPNYYRTYNLSVSHEERIHQVLGWLDLPAEERPDVIVAYMSAVDHAGHLFGPDSIEMDEALAKADSYITMLMDGLKVRNLHNCANVIVLADHGMADISCDRKTSIEDFGVDMDAVYFRKGAVGKVGPSHDPSLAGLFDAEAVYDLLKCTHNTSHWQAFLKTQYLPKRFHYAHNSRIEDVILSMDDGWLAEGRKNSLTDCNGGSHGFDNEFNSMHALFAGHGPGFKRQYNTTKPFENIEVYNLMADLLEIEAAPNNGTRGSLYHVMSKPINITSDIPFNVQACFSLESRTYIPPCSTCPDLNVTAANSRILNFVSDETLLGFHAPYGLPQTRSGNILSCMLYHQDYINEYDQYMRLPLYVAYTVQNKTRTKSQPNKCIRPDIRLPQESSSKCIKYGSTSETHVSHSFLYPPELSTGVAVHDASVETNVVPMYDSTQQVWNYMAKVVSQWSNLLGNINVIAGPVFDYDYDGHRDNMAKLMRIGKFTKIGINSVPVPTHFFMILSRCKQCTDNMNMTSPNGVDLLSFVVPNYAEEPCHETDQTPSEWIPNTLKEHVARIRDVELLTGISFLPIWTHSRDVHQETRIEAIRLRLNLPGSDNQWMKLFLNEPLDYS